MNDIEVTFPGGKRVDARVGEFIVHTDQPIDQGGGGTAPGPFDLFLASLATCAGLYALAFCQARQLSTEGLSLRQSVTLDEKTKLPSLVSIEILLPGSFPEKYRVAIARAAEGCKVKRTIAGGPTMEVTARSPLSAITSKAS